MFDNAEIVSDKDKRQLHLFLELDQKIDRKSVV
jgi:hypothetical protein